MLVSGVRRSWLTLDTEIGLKLRQGGLPSDGRQGCRDPRDHGQDQAQDQRAEHVVLGGAAEHQDQDADREQQSGRSHDEHDDQNDESAELRLSGSGMISARFWIWAPSFTIDTCPLARESGL